MKKMSVLLLSLFLLFTPFASAENMSISLPEGLNAREARLFTRAAKAKPKAVSKLKKLCKKIITLRPGQALIKSQISAHIPRGDARASGYTFVCGSLCASFPAPFYYSDGTLAGKLGYYGRYSANGRPRAYCAAGGAPRCSVSSIYAKARRKKTGSYLYLKSNSTTCFKFNGAPGARNGGV